MRWSSTRPITPTTAGPCSTTASRPNGPGTGGAELRRPSPTRQVGHERDQAKRSSITASRSPSSAARTTRATRSTPRARCGSLHGRTPRHARDPHRRAGCAANVPVDGAQRIIAGLLFSLDGLEFVQSRTAMLDIYLMFWILAAFACLVIDRDGTGPSTADADQLVGPLGPDDWGDRRSASESGGWAGPESASVRACATKWDGAFYIPAFLALAVAWDVGARRTGGNARRHLGGCVQVRRSRPRGIRRRTGGGLRRVVDRVVRHPLRLQPQRRGPERRPHVTVHDRRLARLTTSRCSPSAWACQVPQHYQSNPLGWLILARPIVVLLRPACPPI